MAAQDVESPRCKRVPAPQENIPLQQLKRAKRTPGGDAYVDNKQHFREFINRLVLNDPTLGTLNGRVLRVKNYVSPDASPAQIDMVIECLKHNVRVEVLYIQNFEKGFGDKQLESLTDVLRQKRIWAVNIGENLGVSIEAWHQFAKAMPETIVAYMYISEHKLKGTDLKHHMRTVMRYNRKILGPRDPYLCSMVHNMWYNPAPFLCDSNAPEYECDGLMRAYATEEEVRRRHEEDVKRIEGRRAALSAVGMPTPSIPPNPDLPEPTVELLKMFVFEDSHLFPPRLKLVPHCRTGHQAQLILPEELVQPDHRRQVHPCKPVNLPHYPLQSHPRGQRTSSAAIPASSSASGGCHPARGSPFEAVLQQGHRGERDECRSIMQPLRKAAGRGKVTQTGLGTGRAARHLVKCTASSSRSSSLAGSGSHTSGQSTDTVHWPLFHTLAQGHGAARAAQPQAPQVPVLQPRRKLSKVRVSALSRQASQDMMTTRRAASSSAVSSPRCAVSSPRHAAASPRRAASSPRHAEASVSGARMQHRCIALQWASARLKIIQDEAKEAAAVAAAEAAAAKRARAAEAAANPLPPAPVAAVIPADPAPQPQRLHFVTDLPDVLGKKWKPGDPVPSQAQIDAARHLGDNRRRIRVRPLSACGLDGKGPPVQPRPPIKRRVSKRPRPGSCAPASMVAHNHDIALPVAHPCANNGELNVSVHGVVFNKPAHQPIPPFGATAGSWRSSCQSTQAWTGAHMYSTGPHQHPPVMPLANANVECGATAPWLDPGRPLQHVDILQAHSAVQSQRYSQQRASLGVDGGSNCGERRSGSGLRGSDLSADGSAGSAMTLFSNGAAAGMLPAHHPLQHVQTCTNAGFLNERAQCIQPADSAQRPLDSAPPQRSTVNLNPGKQLLIHAYRDSHSAPYQQYQLAEQDFGLWGTDHAPGKRIPRVPHVVTTNPTRASFGLMITKRMRLFKQECAEAGRRRAAEELARRQEDFKSGGEASDGESQDLSEDDVSSEAGSGLEGREDDVSSSSAADSEYDSLSSDEEDEEWDAAEVLEEAAVKEAAVNADKDKLVRLSRQCDADKQAAGGGVTQTSASVGGEHERHQWGAIAPLEIVPGMGPVEPASAVESSAKVLDVEFVEPQGEADTSSSEDDSDNEADVQQSCDAAGTDTDEELWHTMATGRPCTLGMSVVQRPNHDACREAPGSDAHCAQELHVPPDFAPATPIRAPVTPPQPPASNEGSACAKPTRTAPRQLLTTATRQPPQPAAYMSAVGARATLSTPAKPPVPKTPVLAPSGGHQTSMAGKTVPKAVSPRALQNYMTPTIPAAPSDHLGVVASTWPPRVVPLTGCVPRTLQGAAAAPCEPVKGTMPAEAHVSDRTCPGAVPEVCVAAGNTESLPSQAVFAHKGLAASGLQNGVVEPILAQNSIVFSRVGYVVPPEPQEPVVPESNLEWVTHTMDGNLCTSSPTKRSIDASGGSATAEPPLASSAAAPSRAAAQLQTRLHSGPQSVVAAQQHATQAPVPSNVAVHGHQSAVQGQACGSSSVAGNVINPRNELHSANPKSVPIQAQPKPPDRKPALGTTPGATVEAVLAELRESCRSTQHQSSPVQQAPKATPQLQPVSAAQFPRVTLQSGAIQSQQQITRPQGRNLTAMCQLRHVLPQAMPSYKPHVKAPHQASPVGRERSDENVALTVNKAEKGRTQIQAHAPTTRRRSSGGNRVLNVKGEEKAWNLNEEDTEEEDSACSFDDESSSSDCDSGAGTSDSDSS